MFPLLLLSLIQIRNFLHGKTTLERYGKGGNNLDRESRIRNSGIERDVQVYIDSMTSVASLSG